MQQTYLPLLSSESEAGSQKVSHFWINPQLFIRGVAADQESQVKSLKGSQGIIGT